MNLILLEPSDFVATDRARISGRRLRHVREVHRVTTGKRLAVGLLGGGVGTGLVGRIDELGLELTIDLDGVPPPKLPLTILLALPRPKVLSRVLADLASLGVSRIVLVNSWRVEKAYWSSPRIGESEMREALLLGLEQAKDTILPELHVERFFEPFVHGRLTKIAESARKFVAHPGATASVPRDVTTPVILAIGPEGGWIDRELESFRREGFEDIRLGARPLRVETAVAAIVGRLYA